MSAEALITTIENLLALHKSLSELAIKKTDIIKTGDMDALHQLLDEEQTHISAIEQMERKRQQAAQVLAPHIDQPKVSDCLDSLSAFEQNRLTKLTEDLGVLVHDLKEQNHLNQQLIHNSLQFVNVSMNLLRPQPDNINYEPPTKSKKPSDNSYQGLFNSKA